MKRLGREAFILEKGRLFPCFNIVRLHLCMRVVGAWGSCYYASLSHVRLCVCVCVCVSVVRTSVRNDCVYVRSFV